MTNPIRSITLLWYLTLVCTGVLPSCGSGQPTGSLDTGGVPAPLAFVWDAPESGVVDYYLVMVSTNEGPFEIADPFVYERRYSFEPSERCSYRLQVQAYNAAGGGPPSDPSDRVNVYMGRAAADSDEDLMPDAWEALVGLDPRAAADAAADPDADGLTNLEEYRRGSDPWGL